MPVLGFYMGSGRSANALVTCRPGRMPSHPAGYRIEACGKLWAGQFKSGLWSHARLTRPWPIHPGKPVLATFAGELEEDSLDL